MSTYRNTERSNTTADSPLARCGMNLDGIVQRGYFSAPQTDPVMAMITDRRDSLSMGLDDAIQQLRSRYDIYRLHMYDLELAKLSAINSFHTWHMESQHLPPEQRQAMHQMLHDLYTDQRTERAAFWRDASRIRQAMPQWVQDYLGALRKTQILDDNQGDPL